MKKARENECALKATTTKLKAHFSGETTSQKAAKNTSEVLKGKKPCQQRSLYTAKIHLKNEGEIKNFPK